MQFLTHIKRFSFPPQSGGVRGLAVPDLRTLPSPPMPEVLFF